jgi:glycogen debranching enzyme
MTLPIQFNSHVCEDLVGTNGTVWPGGCIAQAWSVAEVLRTYIEDAKGIQPA